LPISTSSTVSSTGSRIRNHDTDLELEVVSNVGYNPPSFQKRKSSHARAFRSRRTLLIFFMFFSFFRASCSTKAIFGADTNPSSCPVPALAGAGNSYDPRQSNWCHQYQGFPDFENLVRPVTNLLSRTEIGYKGAVSIPWSPVFGHTVRPVTKHFLPDRRGGRLPFYHVVLSSGLNETPTLSNIPHGYTQQERSRTT